MFYVLAGFLFIAGVTCLSFDPIDVQLDVEGVLLILLSVVYIKEGNTDRQKKKARPAESVSNSNPPKW